MKYTQTITIWLHGTSFSFAPAMLQLMSVAGAVVVLVLCFWSPASSLPPLPNTGKLTVNESACNGVVCIHDRVNVCSAAGVRLYYYDKVLPNYAMIRSADIHEPANTAVWCQSALNDSNVGTWMLPSGMAPTNQLYTTNEPGQVGLHRRTSFGRRQGVYRCIIRDETNTTHTLFVWIYHPHIFDPNGIDCIK